MVWLAYRVGVEEELVRPVAAKKEAGPTTQPKEAVHPDHSLLKGAHRSDRLHPHAVT